MLNNLFDLGVDGQDLWHVLFGPRGEVKVGGGVERDDVAVEEAGNGDEEAICGELVSDELRVDRVHAQDVC